MLLYHLVFNIFETRICLKRNTGVPKVERRKMERFSLELPALLSIVDESGNPKTLEAMTNNICAGGVYCLMDKPLSVGTDVKMDLTISLKKVNKKTRINVSGSVIRTEDQGMAVCFGKRYRIEPFKDKS